MRMMALKEMEARVGIEPTIEDLQSSALPLGDRAITNNDPSRGASVSNSSEFCDNFFQSIR